VKIAVGVLATRPKSPPRARYGFLVELYGPPRRGGPNLRYLEQRYPAAAAWQVHMQGKKDFASPEGVRVAHALELLQSLV
jgi:hypothetical protein